MTIKDVPFFINLSNKKLKRLEQISIQKKYEKGEILFFEGEDSHKLLILLRGAVKLYKTLPKGREVFLHTIRPISLVAEVVTFEGIKYPASAVFVTSGEVIAIDYSKFYDEFMCDAFVCQELIKSLSQKLRVLNSVFEQELILTSEGKVALFICENFDLFCEMKQTNIAKILNTTPETLSRIVTRFKRKGLLRVDENGKIIGYDLQGLSGLYDS